MRKEAQKTDYVLAALVAAAGAHLGHRWARYIGGNWSNFVRAYEEGLVGQDFLADIPDNPFIADDALAYDISAVLRAYARQDTGYLDLVLGVPPEHFPVLLTEEAERALREGDALAFLTKHTYLPNEVPGVNSPGIVCTELGCRWKHVTTTGRGRFLAQSAPGRLDFHFRIERGGEYLGLTAFEVFLRRAIVAGNISNYQVTPFCEERHREYAVDILQGIAREIPNIPGATKEAVLLGQELAKIASSLARG